MFCCTESFRSGDYKGMAELQSTLRAAFPWLQLPDPPEPQSIPSLQGAAAPQGLRGFTSWKPAWATQAGSKWAAVSKFSRGKLKCFLLEQLGYFLGSSLKNKPVNLKLAKMDHSLNFPELMI